VSDRIDISEPTRAICEAVGLDPADVLELYWTPRELTATVALKNEHGSKYIHRDGSVALEERVFEVTA
jgi:hydrogenase maturation factor